jgi:hypothetical protein
LNKSILFSGNHTGGVLFLPQVKLPGRKKTSSTRDVPEGIEKISIWFNYQKVYQEIGLELPTTPINFLSSGTPAYHSGPLPKT